MEGNESVKQGYVLLAFGAKMALMTLTVLASVASQLFLGEAYPSGNAYLKPFAVEASARQPPLKSMPETLILHCLKKKACDDAAVEAKPRLARRNAYFVAKDKAYTDAKTSEVIQYTDTFRAQERVDAMYLEDCRLPYKAIKSHRYADDHDFFDTYANSCAAEEGVIVHYKLATAPKNAAYQVLAIAPKLGLTDVRYPNKDEKRPLSTQEEKEVTYAKTKAQDQKDCTTQPQYLDDAEIVLWAKLKSSGQSIRLSTYNDPGCGGHAVQYYILDVGKGDNYSEHYTMERTLGIL